MEYIPIKLKTEIVINKIVTIHYFEYAKDFIYSGEKHDFWELLYVDKGEVEVMADNSGYKLKQGEIIFHKPNEFHNLWANGKIAPNLIVFSFICNSSSIKYFENKILSINNTEKTIIGNIITEAKAAFKSDLSKTNLKVLEKSEDYIFGSEQMIKIHLENLLISLIRKKDIIKNTTRLSKSTKIRSDDNLFITINEYMIEQLKSNITIKDISKFSNMSSSLLKSLFKGKTEMGIIEYFNSLKIKKAKDYIRESDMNLIIGICFYHIFNHTKFNSQIPYKYSKQLHIV